MKKKFSVAQIVGVLKQAEVGVPIASPESMAPLSGRQLNSLQVIVTRSLAYRGA